MAACAHLLFMNGAAVRGKYTRWEGCRGESAARSPVDDLLHDDAIVAAQLHPGAVRQHLHQRTHADKQSHSHTDTQTQTNHARTRTAIYGTDGETQAQGPT